MLSNSVVYIVTIIAGGRLDGCVLHQQMGLFPVLIGTQKSKMYRFIQPFNISVSLLLSLCLSLCLSLSLSHPWLCFLSFHFVRLFFFVSFALPSVPSQDPLPVIEPFSPPDLTPDRPARTPSQRCAHTHARTRFTVANTSETSLFSPTAVYCMSTMSL